VPTEAPDRAAISTWLGETLGAEAVATQSGQRLFLADRTSLREYDLSDASNPRLVKEWAKPPFVVRNMVLSGDILFIAADQAGLFVADVAR
jgi:hypothetical protein